MNSCMRNKGLIIGDIRNRGNVELSDAVWLFCPPRYQGRFDWRMWPNHLNSPQSKAIQQYFPQAGVDSPSILKKTQHSPAGLKSSSPVDSASLSPAKYERLAQVLFRVISSQGLITGLSSAKSHGRPFPAKVPSIPSEVYLWFSPAEFIIIILSGIHC